MTPFGFKVTLRDPVALPVDAKDGIPVRSLSYIPGSVMLGIVAGRLYPDLEREEAFALFHSGRTVFADAFPVHQGSGFLQFPAPLCLHKGKGARPRNVSTSDIRDFAADRREMDYKQLSGIDVIMDGVGTFVRPSREQTLRTAISLEDGRAEKAQFFGYEALSAGQVFWGSMMGVHPDQLDAVEDALLGEHYIGRSKTAEYGRVTIERAPLPDFAESEPGLKARYVWLLSDTAFIDALGFPTACPRPEDFGAEEIDWAHSFLSTRSAAPFNATWRARAQQMPFALRGSVFRLRGSTAEPGLHRYGLRQESGHGLAYLSHAPLSEILLKRRDGLRLAQTSADGSKQPEPPGAFMAWIEYRAGREMEQTARDQRAREDTALLLEFYKTARRFAGSTVGPPTRDWETLRHATEAAARALITPANDEGDLDWGVEFPTSDGHTTFRLFALQVLDRDGGIEDLRQIATIMARVLKTSITTEHPDEA